MTPQKETAREPRKLIECDPEEHEMEWEGNYEYGELYICSICGHEEVRNGIF